MRFLGIVKRQENKEQMNILHKLFSPNVAHDEARYFVNRRRICLSFL